MRLSMKGIKQLANGRWQADIRRTGFPRVRRNFRTKGMAEAWKTKTVAAMDAGTYVTAAQIEAEEAEAMVEDTRVLTLRQAVNRYLDEVTSVKEGGAKTAETESTALNQLLTMPYGDAKLTTITTSHIADFVSLLESWGNVSSTINRKLTTINHLFVKAKKWHMPELTNPVTGNKQSLGAGGRRRSRKFEGKEEEALMTALDACLNPYIKHIVIFALETGMRRREILESRNVHVTLGKRPFIHLPAPITKSRIARNVPLSPAAVNIIKEVRKLAGDEDLIFPVTVKAFEEAWKKTIKRAGLVDFEFRDTRHIALTRLSKIYPRAQDLARISGHEKLDTLLTYYEESIEEQCDIMTAYFNP